MEDEATQYSKVFIITHRFTNAMHADLIHVMEVVRIAESRTYRQLIAVGAHYAELRNAQVREIGYA